MAFVLGSPRANPYGLPVTAGYVPQTGFAPYPLRPQANTSSPLSRIVPSLNASSSIPLLRYGTQSSPLR